ncbi:MULTISPECIES: ATP phosphoribosyltransferase [Salimicrobium]|uniref:ATP phosphoribosyltransferase n=4 Tax=Salimicrobium TaxID=351195 RepID=K2HBL4_9BACI|nr:MULTISPECIES: ATP phosphoribosyltransferase [Salimicrobium]AKG03927.1 ATP phosphoribosyltransferase [Salimicrobium jeotgali]EKE32960.1 ATP phosphoribosyltransferase catalytic subunit [Salimicrobium jeotgali]MBM7695044.1 ATP phosphoribosyltransferase [Salimicrobium jeotgali]PBB06218.1 ATP phosphoribosyltransferase [Salimicrobium humidisoli]SDX98563.1 ATP phosphoribosyltransferase [Salimicrobium album]
MTKPLTIAMPKGRIFEEAAGLMQQAGYDIGAGAEESRKLILEFPEQNINVMMAKPMDVVTYVEYGAADIGIAGKDVLLEQDRDVYEVLDLKISPCYIAVAGLPDQPLSRIAPKIATKYPKVASDYYREQGEQIEIIPLNGSIELAPLIGLSDRIVDIVSTGRTLKENGLVEYEKITEITSRLIVNPVSYRTKSERIDPLIEKMGEQVGVNS